MGRFISPDNVVPDYFHPQMLNRYSYALNNPLRYVDPNGHEAGDYDHGMGYDSDAQMEDSAGDSAAGNGGGSESSGSPVDAYGSLVETGMSLDTPSTTLDSLPIDPMMPDPTKYNKYELSSIEFGFSWSGRDLNLSFYDRHNTGFLSYSYSTTAFGFGLQVMVEEIDRNPTVALEDTTVTVGWSKYTALATTLDAKSFGVVGGLGFGIPGFNVTSPTSFSSIRDSLDVLVKGPGL